jgi:hypothetical protein
VNICANDASTSAPNKDEGVVGSKSSGCLLKSAGRVVDSNLLAAHAVTYINVGPIVSLIPCSLLLII